MTTKNMKVAMETPLYFVLEVLHNKMLRNDTASENFVFEFSDVKFSVIVEKKTESE